jgi:hypothetical protein
MLSKVENKIKPFVRGVQSSSKYDQVITERSLGEPDDRNTDENLNVSATASRPLSALPLPGNDQFFFDDEIVGSLVAAANRRLEPEEPVKSPHGSDSKSRATKLWDYATSLYGETGYNGEGEEEVDSQRMVLIGVPTTISASKVSGCNNIFGHTLTLVLGSSNDLTYSIYTRRCGDSQILSYK